MTQHRIEAGQIWERKRDGVRYRVTEPTPSEFANPLAPIIRMCLAAHKQKVEGLRWTSPHTLRRDYRLVEEKAR